jgi:hypothetical protein
LGGEVLDGLADAVNADDYLVHRGRWVTAEVMISVGDTDHLVSIERGRIAAVRTGPFVTPTYSFRLAAPADEWAAFWSPAPEPGHHDLFAMLRRKTLTAAGDLHVFMANLRYFKDVLAKPRQVAL